MKKLLTSLIVACGLAASASALDLTFRLSPGVIIPSDSNYEMGYGGFIQGDVDLFGFMTMGLEGQFHSVTSKGLDDSVSIAGGGAGLGFYYSPLSRLYLGAGGAGGIYQISTKLEEKEQSASDFYYRGYGEIGFRVTPEFTVSATGGYMSYLVSGEEPFMSGVTAGLSLRYTFSTNGGSSASFGVDFDQSDAAFPLFMKAYRTCPLGYITLKNNESSDIRNVKVSFRAGKYTSSTFQSASISRLGRHSSEEIPLNADFSSEILRYSENGKISGEIVVDYELLGKKKQSVQNVTILMYNRNAFLWTDPSGLSAFISSDTPEILQVAKQIAGIERNSFIPGMNENFQISAAMYEALRLGKIKYNEDKSTPYKTCHLTDDIDSIQYPLQTLQYLSGDLDDLGILYSSCLESVGVPTGFMPLKDDFIVLVGMNIRAGTEKNHFASTDGLIVDESNVYFGVSMADLSKGFTAARKSAAKKIAAAKKDSDNAYDYVVTHSGWEVYAPAVYSGVNSSFEVPAQSSIEKAAKAAVNDYISADLGAVLARAQKAGDSNKIGVALLRSGRLAEAKAEFSKSNSTSAMNNLANCYMIEKNYTAALNTYNKVLAKDPENRIAKAGVESAKERLGQ